jgi:hypothetical protein
MLGLFEIADSDRIPHKKSARSIKTNSVASNISQSLPKSVHSTETTASSNSPSSTSFPNNREWFRRLASYTSVPESVGRNSNQAITNEVIELISRCLYKCGEEEGYMPLFKVIFTTLSDVDENRYTRLLDGRARDILLTGVITRMVLYISKHVGLVFVCDDVQCKYQ